MTKPFIMRLVNRLLEELEYTYDEEFTDRVVAAVSYNQPFTEDEIAEAGGCEFED